MGTLEGLRGNKYHLGERGPECAILHLLGETLNLSLSFLTCKREIMLFPQGCTEHNSVHGWSVQRATRSMCSTWAAVAVSFYCGLTPPARASSEAPLSPPLLDQQLLESRSRSDSPFCSTLPPSHHRAWPILRAPSMSWN